MTALPPALPPKTASTPIRNSFLNRLLTDPTLNPPPLELLALIDVLDQHLAAMSSRIARLEVEE